MRARGEANPKAKLCEADVLAIRTRHDAGRGEPIGRLAGEFGISAGSAGLIVTGRTWKHVGGPTRPVQTHRIIEASVRCCPLDGCELTHTTNGSGRLVIRCIGCERRRAGRCMDCDVTVRGRAWRCDRHKRERRRKVLTLRAERNRDEINARQRKAYRQLRGAERQAHLDYKREWRRKNRKKVLLQKRRARLAGKPCGWATREKYLAYHAAYRARTREHRRELARAHYYREHPERPSTECVVCGADVGYTGRGRPSKLCPAHRQIVRLAQVRVRLGYAA